jgi:hypothetical protein
LRLEGLDQGTMLLVRELEGVDRVSLLITKGFEFLELGLKVFRLLSFVLKFRFLVQSLFLLIFDLTLQGFGFSLKLGEDCEDSHWVLLLLLFHIRVRFSSSLRIPN